MSVLGDDGAEPVFHVKRALDARVLLSAYFAAPFSCGGFVALFACSAFAAL